MKLTKLEKQLISIINHLEEDKINLLRRLPFDDLSQDEKMRVILNDVADTFKQSNDGGKEWIMTLHY